MSIADSGMRPMKVLVLNPASIFSKNVVRDVLYGCWCAGKRIGGGTVVPFEQLGVATLLKEAGHEVRFLDAAAEAISLRELKDRTPSFQAVVISTSTMTVNEDAMVIAALKEVKPDLFCVVYGSHPTFLPAETLTRRVFDVIVRREPGPVVREVLGRLEQGEDWRSCLGIGYLENGRPVIKPHAPFVSDLDSLPHLDVDLLPVGVHYFNPLVKRLPYMATSTSAGCPGKCTYCTAPFFHGKKLRLKSAARVLEEISYYLSRGFKEIYFRDETFTASPKRVREICAGILERGLDVTWIANARVGTVDEDLLALMKRAGCHYLKVGVESGDQDILDGVQKGIRIKDTRALFAAARRVGVDTHAHTMLGMPGETVQTINKTIDFVIALKPTTATFGVCTPYPGTPLFERVAALNPEIKDGSDADLSKLHKEGHYNELYTSLSADYLRRAVRMAYRRFYLRPAYLAKTLGRVKDLDDLKRFALAGTRVFDFSVRGE